MQLLACHNGRLLRTTLSLSGEADDALASRLKPGRAFRTQLAALDAIAPDGAFACGAVHEILADPAHGSPKFFAAMLARAALNESSVGGGRGGAVVWCDPDGELYPPALAGLGIPLDRLYLLRPRTLADEAWAVAEALRCPGVAATVATVRPGRGRYAFTRTQARRLQLAAERGGGAGILIRPCWGRAGSGANIYAAATRWLVEPAGGERNVQKWRIQLTHGHGGRLNQAIILEHHRDQRSGTDPDPDRQTHPVRAVKELADRPLPAAAATTRPMRISA
jgi:protein ImuA